jgi:hypothetical protein
MGSLREVETGRWVVVIEFDSGFHSCASIRLIVRSSIFGSRLAFRKSIHEVQTIPRRVDLYA